MECEFDVLLVGAGPVGLALANALGRSGLRTLVVEQEPGVATLPRAVSIDDEAMRLLQELDLVDSAYGVTLPGTGTRYYDRKGGPLFHAGSGAPTAQGHPVKNPVDHSELQQVLWDGAERFPEVTIRPSTKLTSIKSDKEGISAELEQADGSSTRVTARRAVGCDGGRSTVRKSLGIEMKGSSSPQRWLVVDVLNDPHDERYAMHFGDPHRPHVIVPGRGGRCRYEFLLWQEERPAEARLRSFAGELIHPYRGELEDADVVRCVVYNFHSLVAEEWMRGPIALAGDAAHMMPPFAGQGLNSGFRDASNLAWKLSLELSGVAGPPLLETYEQERRPHVEAMLALSERMGDVMMTRSRTRAAMRDVAVRVANAIPPTRRFLREMRFRPPAQYQEGFFVPGPKPVGSMLAQTPVVCEGGRTEASDELLGRGFVLLAVDVEGAALEGLSQPIWSRLGASRVHLRLGHMQPLQTPGWRGAAVEEGPLTQQLGEVSGQVLLVRPDRFVAGAFSPTTAGEIERELGRLAGGDLGSSSPLGAPMADPPSPIQ